MAANNAPFQDPAGFFQTLRWDPPPGTGFTVGVVAGTEAAILGGPIPGTHANQADRSTIINGNNNSIFSTAPPVGNEIYNLIGNGLNQKLTGYNSSIINGEENTINPSAGPVDTHFATVVNGHSNVISGDFSFIGGGGGTPATGNTVEATYGFIGNGSSNHIYIGSDNGVIGGGTSNEIATAGSGFASPLSFIGGGEGNAIRTNTAPGAHNVIAGGFFNEICDNSARTMIGGGDHNHAQGSFTFIGGGNQNFALGDGNTVAGGIGNNIRVNSSASFIGGGGSNAICGQHDTIAGGNGNGILHGANSSVIGGGFVNFIGNPTAIPASNPSNFSFIGGGAFNCIDTNNTTNSEYNTLTGGFRNIICADSSHSFIGGGQGNVLTGDWTSIVGGCNNQANCCFNVIAGGLNNVINLSGLAPVGTIGILSGNNNQALGHSVFSSIGNGVLNKIDSANGSFIGSGYNNCIASTPGGPDIERSFIGTGQQNSIFESNASIVNGDVNTVNVGGVYSFIGGGINNTVSGACSAILGGENNNVTHAYAAVFGNGVNSVAPDTFHVSCLNAVNTPIRPGGLALPSGSIFRYNAALGPVPAGALPLYIMP